MDDNEWANSEKEACSASFSYWAATGKSTGWNWPLGWKRSNEENRHLPTSFLGLFYPTLKKKFQALFTNDIYYGWQWMGQQWERSLFCQFQLLGSHWEVHWLKLTPGLNRVLGGKTTPPNIFFRPILPKFEEIFEIVVGDFERWPMLPVRKTNNLTLPFPNLFCCPDSPFLCAN